MDGWMDGNKDGGRGEESKTEEVLIPLAPPVPLGGAAKGGGAGAQKAEKNKKSPLKRLRFGFEEQMKGSDASPRQWWTPPTAESSPVPTEASLCDPPDP